MTQGLTSHRPVLTTDGSIDTSQVPFAITDRCFIPRQRYFDRTFFELENEKLWPHVWQMACRLEEIPHVGDFVEYWVARYSVIVVRTGENEIKAYQNACRHRGTQLAVGCGTFQGGQIVCPFHGWRWNLDGTPAHLYGGKGFDARVLDPRDLELIECQVGTWANCVFINMDRSAPPLLDALEPLPRFLDAMNVGEMYVDWWKAVRLRANWKIAMEAFMEGWHTMATHPQLTLGAGEQFPADFLSVQHSYPNGHASLEQGHDNDVQADLGLTSKAEAERTLAFMRAISQGLGAMVLEKDVQVIEGLRNIDCAPEKFSANMIEAIYAWNSGAGIRLPAPDPEVLGRWGSQWFVFPNFMIHPLFGNAISYRVRPDSDDPEHCYFELWSLTLYPRGQEPGKPVFGGVHPIDDESVWPLVPRQDFSNIERQQRGLHTPGYRAQRLARKYEDGIANMHAHLDTYLAR
jgi:phenylpropionate dioxygenase-like ring-hydroxylating dioxygenase large terminal subunit